MFNLLSFTGVRDAADTGTGKLGSDVTKRNQSKEKAV